MPTVKSYHGRNAAISKRSQSRLNKAASEMRLRTLSNCILTYYNESEIFFQPTIASIFYSEPQ